MKTPMLGKKKFGIKLIIELLESLSEDQQIQACAILFKEYRPDLFETEIPVEPGDWVETLEISSGTKGVPSRDVQVLYEDKDDPTSWVVQYGAYSDGALVSKASCKLIHKRISKYPFKGQLAWF